MTSDNLLSYFRHLTGPVFGFELDAYLRDVNRNLVGFVTESSTGAVEGRLFGDVPDGFMDFLNQPLLRIPGPAAGYRVAFREKLAGLRLPLDRPSREFLSSLKADLDVFLIANDVLREEDPLVRAICLHEMCHLVEDARLTACLPFRLEAGHGRELYESIRDPKFRRFHTPLFCDLLTQAARRACEIGEPFTDEHDLVGKAMYYDFEGESRLDASILRLAFEYHCQGMNKPAFFERGYLPKIDAMYRGQVRVTRDFSESPVEPCVVQGRFRRPCYVIRDDVYRQVASRLNQGR